MLVIKMLIIKSYKPYKKQIVKWNCKYAFLTKTNPLNQVVLKSLRFSCNQTNILRDREPSSGCWRGRISSISKETDLKKTVRASSMLDWRVKVPSSATCCRQATPRVAAREEVASRGPFHRETARYGVPSGAISRQSAANFSTGVTW